MQLILEFPRYCLEFQQARPRNFVKFVMFFVRANVERMLTQQAIIIDRAMIRGPICRSTNGRLNVNARSRLQLRTGETRYTKPRH
jgi:hypothetical protein